jgi:hypothetical protein
VEQPLRRSSYSNLPDAGKYGLPVATLFGPRSLPSPKIKGLGGGKVTAWTWSESASLAYLKGLNDSELMLLVVWTVWLTVIGAAIIRTFRGRLSDALQAALVWAMVALVLVAAYTYRSELSDIGNRILEKLVPGRGAGAAISNTFKIKAPIAGIHQKA